MSSRMDDKLRAVTTELAASAPLAPPMPRLERQTRRSIQGLGVAVASFAAIVVIALAAFAGWNAYSSQPQDVASSDVFTAVGATPVAVVTKDGATLRGYLWTGSESGVAMVPAYGEKAQSLLPMALSAHDDGSTVLLVDPRGQGASSGEQDANLLVSDLEDISSDLLTRGVDEVTVVGIRHTATAALVLATAPPEGVRAVVAFFPFEQYQGVDALSVVAQARVPLTVVGASQPSDLGPWAGHLITDAPEGTTGILLPPLPSDALFMDHYREAMIQVLIDATG